MVARQPAVTPTQLRNAMRASARPFPTTGADNGSDPTPVTACVAPVSSVDQLQCYCNTRFCGAGMLDAGRSIDAIVRGASHIEVSTLSPTADRVVELNGNTSVGAPGATISAYAWTLVNGGGIVSGFTARNGATASVTPSGAGSFTVQLQVTDSAGNSNANTATITVAAAPSSNPTPPPSAGSGSGGGGGGAASGAWVLGVGLAAFVLRRIRLRASRQHRA
jgi:serine protease